MVYEALEGKANYSHVYILLIILLLFSQDDIFNENIQKIVSFASNRHTQKNYTDAILTLYFSLNP